MRRLPKTFAAARGQTVRCDRVAVTSGVTTTLTRQPLTVDSCTLSASYQAHPLQHVRLVLVLVLVLHDPSSSLIGCVRAVTIMFLSDFRRVNLSALLLSVLCGVFITAALYFTRFTVTDRLGAVTVVVIRPPAESSTSAAAVCDGVRFVAVRCAPPTSVLKCAVTVVRAQSAAVRVNGTVMLDDSDAVCDETSAAVACRVAVRMRIPTTSRCTNVRRVTVLLENQRDDDDDIAVAMNAFWTAPLTDTSAAPLISVVVSHSVTPADVGAVTAHIRRRIAEFPFCIASVAVMSADAEFQLIRATMTADGANVQRVADTDDDELISRIRLMANANIALTVGKSPIGTVVKALRRGRTTDAVTLAAAPTPDECASGRPKARVVVVLGCTGCGPQRLTSFLAEQQTRPLSYDQRINDAVARLFTVKSNATAQTEYRDALAQLIRTHAAASALPLLLHYNSDIIGSETAAMPLLHLDVATLLDVLRRYDIDVDARIIVSVRAPTIALFDWSRRQQPIRPASPPHRGSSDDVIFKAKVIREQLNTINGQALCVRDNDVALFNFEKLWIEQAEAQRLALFIRFDDGDVDNVFANAMAKWSSSHSTTLFASFDTSIRGNERIPLNDLFAAIPALTIFDGAAHPAYKRRTQAKENGIQEMINAADDVDKLVSLIRSHQMIGKASCRTRRLLLLPTLQHLAPFARQHTLVATLALAIATNRTLVAHNMTISSCDVDDAEMSKSVRYSVLEDGSNAAGLLRVVSAHVSSFDAITIPQRNGAPQCSASALTIQDFAGALVRFLVSPELTFADMTEPAPSDDCPILIRRFREDDVQNIIGAVEYAYSRGCNRLHWLQTETHTLTVDDITRLNGAVGSNLQLRTLNAVDAIRALRELQRPIIVVRDSDVAADNNSETDDGVDDESVDDDSDFQFLLGAVRTGRDDQRSLSQSPPSVCSESPRYSLLTSVAVDAPLSSDAAAPSLLDLFSFLKSDLNSRSSSALSVAYENVVVRKSAVGRNIRFVFVAGTEGSGHHFCGHLLADLQRVSDGGSIEHGAIKIDEHLSNFIWRFSSTNDVNAYVRARSQLLARAKWLINSAPAGDSPQLVIINVMNAGIGGMMSYPNIDSLDKDVNHPVLAILAALFESIGGDFRVIVLNRALISAIDSTMRRRHSFEIVGAENALYFQSRVLHDNTIALWNDVASIDSAFSIVVTLDALKDDVTAFAQPIADHLAVERGAIESALIRRSLTFSVVSSDEATRRMSPAQLALITPWVRVADSIRRVVSSVLTWSSASALPRMRFCREPNRDAATVSEPTLLISTGDGAEYIRWLLEQATGIRTAAVSRRPLPYPKSVHVTPPSDDAAVALVDWQFDNDTQLAEAEAPRKRIYLIRDPLSLALSAGAAAVDRLEEMRSDGKLNLFGTSFALFMIRTIPKATEEISKAMRATAVTWNAFIDRYHIADRFASSSADEVFVLWDDLIAHPRAVITRLASFIGARLDVSALECLLESVARANSSASPFSAPPPMRYRREFDVGDHMSLVLSRTEIAVMDRPFHWTDIMAAAEWREFHAAVRKHAETIWSYQRGVVAPTYYDGVVERIDAAANTFRQLQKLRSRSPVAHSPMPPSTRTTPRTTATRPQTTIQRSPILKRQVKAQQKPKMRTP